ncbi:DUF4232 domain-containing protein [Streptomyces zagrosensis]|uniref:DUF4232 domain-containing protein n=1 Tax=Streptomyces zagrosensis TaxID=1042984 RepID=A0A7W9Q902_9ACTN|nr:DUF4232 domain-containing protein [Streptomyces zagrosensis]MBB5935840.1 hypothetical protein [Streptomyces zagrosensis]
MRTSRFRIATAAGATTALALGLTGFIGAGNATAGGVQTHTGSIGASATVAAHADSAGAQQVTGTVGKQATKASKTTAKAGSAKKAADPRQCNGDEMSYSVLHRFAKQQGEHLLITAVNADSKPCWVTSYPSVMLGDTANVLPHSKHDAPGGKTRITIRPGGKIYSAVALFRDSAKTHTSTSLSVAMRDQTGDTGPASELDAFNAKGTPSKFTWSAADVLNWNTAKPYNF